MTHNETQQKTKSCIVPDAYELGMFVIWDTGRHQQSRILDDLASRFHIAQVHEIHWTPGMTWANFQRFYSDLELRGVYHQLNKGTGPFLVITIIDDDPDYGERLTGRGMRKVNSRFFDAKSLYRDWTGGNGIHCGETRFETDRDFYMLFGSDNSTVANPRDVKWDGSIVELHRDPAGANQWESLSQLFEVLNRVTAYAAIRYDVLAPDDALSCSAPIDIVTEDHYAVHTILTHGNYIPARVPGGGPVVVRVGNRDVRFGIRFPGDHYFDPHWMRQLLTTRVLDSKGYYRPRDEERFWILAYHAVAYRKSISRDLRIRLASLGNDIGVNEPEAEFNENSDRKTYFECLRRRGIFFTTPLDRSVYFNRQILGIQPSSFRHALLILQNSAALAGQRLFVKLQTFYYRSRDTILSGAPWLGDLRRILLSRNKDSAKPVHAVDRQDRTPSE